MKRHKDRSFAYRYFRYGLWTIIPKNYSKPISALLHITNRCNSRCITCNSWMNDDEDIPKEHLFKFADRLSELTGSAEFVLTGGEPLIRKDISDIVGYLSKKGPVRILTNGILLDKGMIDRLADSGISSLSISINGIKPEVHDTSRGTKDSLKKIFFALEYIKKTYPKINMSLSMLIFNNNLDQVIPTIRYANDAGVSIYLQPIQKIYGYSDTDEVNYKFRKKFERVLLNPSRRLDKVLDEIKHYKLKGYNISTPYSFLNNYSNYFKAPGKNKRQRCLISFSTIRLHNNGDVSLCNMYEPLCNIKDCEDIKSVWNGKLATAQRKQMLRCSKTCPSFCSLMPTVPDIFIESAIILRRIIFPKKN